MVLAREALSVALCGALALAVSSPARAHGDVHERIGTLDGELAAHPDDASRWIERGKLHGLDGAWSAAARDFERAHELAPESAEAAFQLARARVSLGAHASALAALDDLARLSPEHPERHELVGRALDGLGRHEEAAAAFARALRARPHPEPGAFVEHALSLQRAGQLDAAIESLEAGVEVLGPLVSLVQVAYDLETTRGRHAEALAWITRLDAPLRGAPRWRVEAASTLHALGRTPEARAALADARAAILALPEARRGVAATKQLEARIAQLEAGFGPSTPPSEPSSTAPRLACGVAGAVALGAALALGISRRRRRAPS